MFNRGTKFQMQITFSIFFLLGLSIATIPSSESENELKLRKNLFKIQQLKDSLDQIIQEIETTQDEITQEIKSCMEQKKILEGKGKDAFIYDLAGESSNMNLECTCREYVPSKNTEDQDEFDEKTNLYAAKIRCLKRLKFYQQELYQIRRATAKYISIN
jgi:vacuolar-type H+-ATPase subunit I/STV1